MDTLLDEAASLEAILMDDVTITRDENGIPTQIDTTVLPTVGADTDRQYVCITLQVTPTPGYPDTSPMFLLRNPRGLDDHSINQIRTAVTAKLEESIGQPVVFDLIDVIREHLTESNLPTGQCVVCLYGFQSGDEFTKTDCYHYLHNYCLARHLTASKHNYDEELAKLPAWQQLQAPKYQPSCPVCREAISMSLEPLQAARPPAELENAPTFQLTDELKVMQSRMADLYLHQKSRGGIIDADGAEACSVISIDSEAAAAGDKVSMVVEVAPAPMPPAPAKVKVQKQKKNMDNCREEKEQRQGGRRQGNRYHSSRRHQGHGRQEPVAAVQANDGQAGSSGNAR